MTDARLPGRWLMNMGMMALSDRAWRVFTAALMLGAEQGTDGVIPRAAFRFLYPGEIPGDTLNELTTAGLIERNTDGGFTVLEWTKTQSAAADVEHQRERNRQKVQAHRDRQKKKPVTGGDTGNVTGYEPGHTPRTGKDRQGQDRQGSIEPAESSDAQAQQVIDWPVAKIPNGEAA